MKKLFLYFITLNFCIACADTASFDLAQRSDHFSQRVTYNHKVDILWVIDNSESMQGHQESLAQNIDAMFGRLLSTKLDFRMATVTTDMRRFLNYPQNLKTEGKFIGEPKVLHRGTPNLTDAFSNMIRAGIDGSTVERGLDAAYVALSDEMLSTYNKDFYRDDAMLAIIVVSDEDDSSAVSSTNMINFLNDLKPVFPSGNQAWVFNFIGVLELNNPLCTTMNQYSSPGYAYMNLANYSNGNISSICDHNLRTAIENINSRIVEIITEFKLVTEPEVETIRVYVNNRLLENNGLNGWTYNVENNSILFHGNGVPPADAIIKIDYKPSK